MKSILKKLVTREQMRFLSWYKLRFGLLPALRMTTLVLAGAKMVRVPVPGTARRVWLRPPERDFSVYDQVFTEAQYAMDIPAPATVVDAGAHIGLASVYFALHYPNAQIVALEPEARNFALLKLNTADFPGVRPVNAGLWSRTARLKIQNSNVDSWSFRVMEAAPGEPHSLHAFGVSELLAAQGFETVDFLKIDVEGSEVEVLSTSPEWIGRVRTLAIELHDRFRPGCRAALDRSIAGQGFREFSVQENVVLTRD